MKPITVLFTGAGGASAIYILKYLKGVKTYRTIAVDMNGHAVGLHIADKGYKVDPSTSPTYFDSIRKIVNQEDVDIIVPLIDEELLGMLDLGECMGIPVLLPKKPFVSMCIDKLRTARELKKNGIPTPCTWSHEDFEKIKDKKSFFPKIIKPKNSRGSRGFMVLNVLGDYDSYIGSSKYDKNDLIFQDFIEGTEYTVSVVVKKNGKIVAIVPKEVVTKKVITKVGITRHNKDVEEVCRKIQEKFKANGPFNVQLIIGRDGVPYVHEINPRFSTTVTLTIESGVNEVDILIKDRMGIETLPIKPFRRNLVMLRYEDQIFVDEHDLQVEKL